MERFSSLSQVYQMLCQHCIELMAQELGKTNY